jgi:hypothetical protein
MPWISTAKNTAAEAVKFEIIFLHLGSLQSEHTGMCSGAKRENKVAPCPERKRLSEAVTDAVQATFRAKADMDQAVKAKQDSELYLKLLTEARAAERSAVTAFHRHCNTHGC